jgi:hypothetical protein
LQECPDVALDAIVEIGQHLAPHQRTEALRTLAQQESMSNEQEQQQQQQQQKMLSE